MDNKTDINNIIENYKNMEKEIVNQLNYVVKHGTTLGSSREYIWKSLFERIVPKKFNIDRSVFIIDSYGNISKEVDLAIYDEQYTPYIFCYGTIKFIPIEAVSAVIECKSTGAEGKDLLAWLDSINNLITGTNSIVRLNLNINYGIDLNNERSTQTSTTPIKILCHMGISAQSVKKFDIVVKADEKLRITFNEGYKNLFDWYLKLNHYYGTNKDRENKLKEPNEKRKCDRDGIYKKLKCKRLEDYEVDKDNTILSFIFQFNQLLMLINNPLFFPHSDYVRMFKDANDKNEN